jgi:hypothetical protein
LICINADGTIAIEGLNAEHRVEAKKGRGVVVQLNGSVPPANECQE